MLTKSPSRLTALTKGRLSLPLIGAPMFIVSGPELVIAQCKAGIVGSFPALNARPQGVLDDWLARITEDLAAHDRAYPDRPAAPFAVNQIVHKSNKRIEDDLALCVKHKAPIVITSLGAREEVNATVHSYGGLVLHDVIDVGFARKAIEKGADGLIATHEKRDDHVRENNDIPQRQDWKRTKFGHDALYSRPSRRPRSAMRAAVAQTMRLSPSARPSETGRNVSSYVDVSQLRS
ncbi:MAG: nitronate monooxygenase, partial [Pseudolabrys sp.]|nr:nitronate monooxygenase [Pseudolabrys sp.]